MIKIGIDIMGGDYAPLNTLEGSLLSLSELSDTSQLCLIGQEEIINDFLEKHPADYSRCIVVPASEVIGMDESPVRAFQQKPDCSLAVGFKKLAEGKIDVFASAGHSGAVMIGALQSVKQIEGILRPCAVSAFPLPSGQKNILVDVGINVDSKPEMLQQFAHIGSVYARTVLGITNPRVALLNTGSEPGKGSMLYQKAHELLSSDEGINFIGNKEPRDFFDGEADVTVCDGFTGNILLKYTEGFHKIFDARHIKDSYLDQLNYEEYGGTPVLGVNGNVVLGHGISSAKAIANMILASETIAKANLANHIREAFKK